MPGIEGVAGGVMSVTGLMAVPAVFARQAVSREDTTVDTWARMLVIGGRTSEKLSQAAMLVGVDDESDAISM
jgi:hypothetical protein